MYKLLLAWRYLRARRIAMASVISVTLGVATLIIVNAVMAGFSREMEQRLNGILSDLVFESHSLSGFPDPQWHIEQIRDVIGDDLAGITATVHVPAMISIPMNGQYFNRQITVIGIDRETYSQVGDFSEFLLHPENRKRIGFQLHNNGYAPQREGFPDAGWEHRRNRVQFERALAEQVHREAQRQKRTNGSNQPNDLPADPYAQNQATGVSAESVDAMTEQYPGVILGIAICSQRGRDQEGKIRDLFYCRPGDDVIVTLPNAASPPRPVDAKFTVVDLYESKMSEYDANFAFVPLDALQELRGMIDPKSGKTAVTSILIKLKPGRDLVSVKNKLQMRFPIDQFPYRISTWRDLQGPLLAAVQMETMILNILLFLIIAVAGFGILGIFSMIVVEKTKDIGILKSLGASQFGVMSIFVQYGVGLGLVGAGIGMVLGLLFVRYINQIADGLAWITGRELFDPTVYYFQSIPTLLDPLTVLGIVFGAVSIAVLASVIPARKASRLHPVEALRYE